MCFGAPSPPQVVYRGPSQAEIDANNAGLEQYRRQASEQQSQLQQQLQEQINRANAQMEEQRLKLDQERQAAAAQQSAMQQGTYAVATSQSDPAAAVTTSAVKEKARPRSSLKISAGAMPAAPGVGLNIGS